MADGSSTSSAARSSVSHRFYRIFGNPKKYLGWTLTRSDGGQPKVHDLGPASFVRQNVRRLEVAMNDARRVSFTFEPGLAVLVRGEVRSQKLQCRPAVQVGILRKVNDTRAAAAKLVVNPKLTAAAARGYRLTDGVIAAGIPSLGTSSLLRSPASLIGISLDYSKSR